jgi:hypothetical protein
MDLLSGMLVALSGGGGEGGKAKAQYDLNPMSAAAGVSVASGAALWTKLCGCTVPQGHRGWLRAWGVLVPDAAKTTLRLAIKVNGSFCKNYPDGINILIAGLRADELEEIWLPLAGGDAVELAAGQASGAAAVCWGRMKLILVEE